MRFKRVRGSLSLEVQECQGLKRVRGSRGSEVQEGWGVHKGHKIQGLELTESGNSRGSGAHEGVRGPQPNRGHGQYRSQTHGDSCDNDFRFFKP